MTGETEFERLVVVIITRSFVQNSRPIPGVQVGRVARQLRGLVEERGLPRPLAENEYGTPGGMTDQECAPLVMRVTDGADDLWLTDVARQLVKACFYPEFKTCRDSYRAVGTDGSCRRQELERARVRVSGSHCVDCPHWVAMEAGPHREFLARDWRRDPERFNQNTVVFLPEDFRRLRRWLHDAARCARGSDAPA